MATSDNPERTPMIFRYATVADGPTLASMNQQLIRDEGHRNPMNLEQLQARMEKFIRNEYKAILTEQDGVVSGYALFRYEEQHGIPLSRGPRDEKASA
jgi:hypothetical protein